MTWRYEAGVTDRVFPHQDASIPVDFGRVVVEHEWDRNRLTILKEDSLYTVSAEFLEDYGAFDVYRLLRPQTWAERERWMVREGTVRRRVERAWLGLRFRIVDAVARRIYPEGHLDSE